MKKTDKRLFLYSGLLLLLVAMLLKGLGGSDFLFWLFFCLAILLKSIFLIATLRTKGFKPSLWLSFILAGVMLIFISLIFKDIYPAPLLRNILFYGAISLKVIGLGLMFFQKGR